eukprot:jgi/Tetstr1/461438/TSEL_006547.t1
MAAGLVEAQDAADVPAGARADAAKRYTLPPRIMQYNRNVFSAIMRGKKLQKNIAAPSTAPPAEDGMLVRLERRPSGLCLDRRNPDGAAVLRWCDRWRTSQGILASFKQPGQSQVVLRHAVRRSECLTVEDQSAGKFEGARVVWAPCGRGAEPWNSGTQLWRWNNGKLAPTIVKDDKICLDFPLSGARDELPLELSQRCGVRASQGGYMPEWSISAWAGEFSERDPRAARACEALRRGAPPYARSYVDGSLLYTYPFVSCAAADPEARKFAIMTQIDIDVEEFWAVYNHETAMKSGSSPKAFQYSVDLQYKLLGAKLSRLLEHAIAHNGTLSVAIRLQSKGTTLKADPALMGMIGPSPTKDDMLPFSWNILAGSLGLWLPPLMAKSIDLHVVSYQGAYNANVGRNVAMEHARSPFIVTVDTDPSTDYALPFGINEMLEPYTQQLCGQFRVLVLPDIEVHALRHIKDKYVSGRLLSDDNMTPPLLLPGSAALIEMTELAAVCSDKTILEAALAAHVAQRYQQGQAENSSVGFDLNDWMHWDKPTAVPERLMGEKAKMSYAFYRDVNFPRFDEGITQDGWNRMSQTAELRAAGYEFVVHPTVAICHSAHHVSSVGRMEEEEDEDGRKPAGSTRLRHEFLPGMVNKHANQETIRMRLRQRSLTRQTCRAGSVA